MKSATLPRPSGHRALLLQFCQNPIPGYPLATVELVETHLNFPADFLQLNRSKAILVLEQPQSFPDDFARGLIPTTLHLAGDELFKFRRERDVHGCFLRDESVDSMPRITRNVQPCYRDHPAMRAQAVSAINSQQPLGGCPAIHRISSVHGAGRFSHSCLFRQSG